MRALIAVLLTAAGFAGLFWWLKQLPPPEAPREPIPPKVVKIAPPPQKPAEQPRFFADRPTPKPEPEKKPSIEESDPGLGLNEEFEVGFGDLLVKDEARAELQALQEELADAEEDYLIARRQGTAIQKRTAKRELELLREKVALKESELAELLKDDEPSDAVEDSAETETATEPATETPVESEVDDE